MIIYIEHQAKNYLQTQKILQKFPNAEIVWIKNYKNIFDKNLPNNFSLKPSFVVAKLTGNSILKAPDGYGHNNKQAYFLKTSLNCIFDCAYCFLKGAFKNDIPVYFVNYEDIKEEVRREVQKKLEEIINKNMRENNNKQVNSEKGIVKNDRMTDDYQMISDDIEEYKGLSKDFGGGKNYTELKNNYQSLSFQNQSPSYKNKIWFYSSDWSDILGMNYISNFLEEFVPFFEQFDNVMIEVRSKSANIQPILDLGFVPENTEFAFSLNPQELINKYEKGTSSLDDRIKAINTLIEKGYKVGLRFLPLLPVKNYEKIYTKFVEEIKSKIPYEKVASTFVSGLLYTKQDYKTILKKYPTLDILYMLDDDDGIFVRESRKIRDFFYKLFKDLDKECFICLDS